MVQIICYSNFLYVTLAHLAHGVKLIFAGQKEDCHTEVLSLLFILGKTDTNTEINQPVLPCVSFICL